MASMGSEKTSSSPGSSGDRVFSKGDVGMLLERCLEFDENTDYQVESRAWAFRNIRY